MLFFFNYITPLKKDLKFIEARYDKAILNFFEFFRFIVIFNVFTFLGYAYMMIYHLVEDWDDLADFCNTFYPSSLFYSNFVVEERVRYVFTCCCFILIGYVLCIYQWIQFDKKQKY